MGTDTAVVKYATETGVEIELSPSTVRDYLVNGNGAVTDQEVVMFIQLCRAQRLNPFLREAYLIKYGDSSPATIVTGKETFLKRADRNPQYDGFEAGVTVVTKDGDLTPREGSLVGGQTEKLVGGWARVYRKDRAHPVFAEVSFHEYEGKTKSGQTSSQWAKMPGTMIRKVAICQAFREAFPEDFGGMYSPEEISHVDAGELPTQPVAQAQAPVETYPEPEPQAPLEVPAEWEDVTEEPSETPAPLDSHTLTFGKHKGLTLADVAREDFSYISWLACKWEPTPNPQYDTANRAIKDEAKQIVGLTVERTQAMDAEVASEMGFSDAEIPF